MTPAPEQTTRWRKSSYSNNDNGMCIECATLGATAWRKSSRSNNDNGACVEIATLPAAGAIGIRDSKVPDGPHLTVSPEAFAAFVRTAATA
ncbi:DUF397 domain-containing protein [Streptomyces armeniacus]|uniref:DUF397 domain-containing protein n=1 Tax=Streptomyces armeniacus TaxID=83291 RepID=A0A345XVR5_9ACTN|nr:DUF397 domain-containing protein [Streptomyces armeniacus]AXK35731.1 DUF397 domain-containing protein [Streptomyces armeniacus]